MIRSYTMVVLIVALTNSTPAMADLLYSIDRLGDELVTFNTSNGAINAIGPIGYDMRATQLTMHNGLLYGLTGNADGFDSTEHRLVAINPATGAMVSNVAVKYNGQNLRLADGLESVDGKLVIAFRDPNLGFESDSHLLGEVSLTGTIANVDNFAAFIPDFDALGLSPSGQLFSVDGVIGQQHFDVYMVDRSPLPLKYDLFGSYPGGPSFNSHELAFSTGGLFVLNIERSEVHRINPSTGELVESISYSNDIVLSGLHAVAIPEPSAIALFAMGISMIAGLLVRYPPAQPMSTRRSY